MNNIEQTRLSSCGKVKQKIKNRGKEKEISIICITQDSSTNKKQKINSILFYKPLQVSKPDPIFASQPKTTIR